MSFSSHVFFSFVGLLDTWVVAIDYDCVISIHIGQTHLFVRFYHFQIDFAYMVDRWIDATDPLDLNSWLVLLMHKSELVLAHALPFYWLLWLCIHGFAVLHLSFFAFLSVLIISFVLLICAPARSSIPLAIFERAWFCDRTTFLFLWRATTNFLLPLMGVSVGAV